ncbi:MAG: hypothetical protein MI924_04620, partial [Chloroflexales bacterium]|nr:hypothetical protein [Chloroflexales bacterium]
AIELSAQAPGRLQLRLSLHRDSPARGPVHGILLDAAGIVRLQRMVRRLPAPFFAQARMALGVGVALLLAAADGELRGAPLGLPLARAEPPELLLPRGLRLLPALPQDLLIPALGMQPETFTIVTSDSRYDVAAAALQPLVSLLSLDPPAQTGVITVRPMTLPPLDFSDLEETPKPPPAPPASAPRPTLPEKEKRSFLERLLGAPPAEPASSAAFQTELRQLAADLEQRGELELAAAFYTYLQDNQRAAACYQRLAGENR